MLRPQVGSANPNWKGGIAKNNYHYTRLFRTRHPEKQRAGLMARAAIASGQLVRPDRCSACGTLCQPHAHHDDYSQPLVVRWLCKLCHIAYHAALRRARVFGAAVNQERAS